MTSGSFRNAVAAAVTPLLAAVLGCGSAQDAAPTAAKGLDPIDAPPRFAPAATVTTIRAGVPLTIPQEEPLLHSDGRRVYLSTPHVPAMFASDDGGLSWSTLNDARTAQGQVTAGATDGAFATSPDGALHWLGLRGNHHVPYQRSTDGGRSWSEPLELSEAADADRQWIAAGRDGALMAVWFEGGQVVSRSSRDHGRSWSAKSVVNATGFPGSLVAGRRPGEFLVAMSDFGNDIVGVSLGRTRDGGATWQRLPLAPDLLGGRLTAFGPVVVNFPFMAADAAGNLYVTYTTDDPLAKPYIGSPLAPQAVFLTRSFDGGDTWTEPLRLSGPGRNGVYGGIVAGAACRVAVAWYEDETGVSRMLPSVWHVRLAAAADGCAAVPTFQVADADAQSHLGTICNECGDFSRLDHLGIAVAPDGQVVVSWVRDNAVNPKDLDIMAARTLNVPLR